jgi:hypothetical protein
MENLAETQRDEQSDSGTHSIVLLGEDITKKHVDTINRLYQEGGEQLEKIGELVLRIGFNNDPKLASSHDPYKEQSYRKLVDHPDLEVSPSTLNRCLRVAVQDRVLQDNGIDSSKLSHAQKRMLIGQRNGKYKAELAKEIIENSLSRSEIEALIHKKSSKPKAKPKEKPASKLDQTFSGLQALIGIDTGSVITEISRDQKALAKLRDEAARVAKWAAELIRQIDANFVTFDTAASDQKQGAGNQLAPKRKGRSNS